MRWILLSIVAALACTPATSVSMKVAHSTQNTIARDLDFALQRFLRSEDIKRPGEEIGNLEERAPAIIASETPLIRKFVQNIKLRLGKQSPGDAFKTLELDHLGTNLFKSPDFSKWVKFVTKGNKNDPDMAIYTTLAARYPDETLVTMLAAAKKIDSTKDIAMKLEGAQVMNWIAKKRSPDDVFKILALDQIGEMGITSHAFSRWTDFIGKASTEKLEVVVYRSLRARYSDQALAKMIAAANEVGSTKALATKLEGVQQTRWKDSHASVDYVFKTVKLDETRTKIFESPLLSAWTNYVASIQPDNPNGIILAKLSSQFKGFSTLPKMIEAATKVSSTKKLANELRSVQFKNWLTQGLTPKKVTKDLGVTNTNGLDKKLSNDYRKFYRKAITKAMN